MPSFAAAWTGRYAKMERLLDRSIDKALESDDSLPSPNALQSLVRSLNSVFDHRVRVKELADQEHDEEQQICYKRLEAKAERFFKQYIPDYDNPNYQFIEPEYEPEGDIDFDGNPQDPDLAVLLADQGIVPHLPDPPLHNCADPDRRDFPFGRHDGYRFLAGLPTPAAILARTPLPSHL